MKENDLETPTEAIKPFLEKYKELVSLCWGLIEENDSLKRKAKESHP